MLKAKMKINQRIAKLKETGEMSCTKSINIPKANKSSFAASLFKGSNASKTP